MRHLMLPFTLAVMLLVALGLFVSAANANLAAQETPLDPDGRPYELNLDSQGMLWISDYQAEQLRAYDTATGVYTIYLGTGKASDARRGTDGMVWWLDQEADSLGELAPATGDYTLWKIPGATSLFGTAVDGQGNLWLSQYFSPDFFRFNPTTEEVCTYTIGTLGGSYYLVVDGTEVWLGDWINDSIHRLDSELGSLTSWALPYNARPEGLTFGPDRDLWWADSDQGHLARLAPGTDRLTTYALPYGADPQMLAFNGELIWYTENQMGSLGRMDPNLAAHTVRTLSTATANLEPECTTLSPDKTGTLTTNNGAIAWTDETYNTTFETGGWWIHALPQDAFPWGIAVQNDRIWFVDTDRQVLGRVKDSPSLTACKLQDADGSPDTSDDQSTLTDWPLYLTEDGVPQETPHFTASDGCTTWHKLVTSVDYGVLEVDTLGWSSLTPATHDFGVLQSGKSYVHSFINAQNVTVGACSLSDADGDLFTTEDQAPLPGSTVFLHVDGVRLEPGEVTGADGCHTWEELAPNHVYGVSQIATSGWKAVTSSSYNFGLALPGEAYTHNFINGKINLPVYLPMIKR